MKNKNQVSKPRNFRELLNAEYGKPGTKKRRAFELGARKFMISEMVKEGRRKASLTQKDLAEKIGTKKSYISRLENGKCDIQISTLYRIFEDGLGKKVKLTIS